VTGANCTQARFVNADLTYADFSHANLTAADLTGATLFRAKLHAILDVRAIIPGRAAALGEDLELAEAENWQPIY
jgi:uncharacterized protein YjbI with pentapeptide repeats